MRRILPYLAYDGMDRYPDPVGPREPIIKALTEHCGPLTYESRTGAVIPKTDDRESLNFAAGLGAAVVLYAAAITRAADGRGLLLEFLHCNATEVEISTDRP